MVDATEIARRLSAAQQKALLLGRGHPVTMAALCHLGLVGQEFYRDHYSRSADITPLGLVVKAQLEASQ